jgi:ribosome-binding protein aMBF1 (putative translation factor)
VPEELPELPEVASAYRAYKQADEEALLIRYRARATLGAVILRDRRRAGMSQSEVADQLGVRTQQVIRYEAAYRAWLKEHPDEPLG